MLRKKTCRKYLGMEKRPEPSFWISALVASVVTLAVLAMSPSRPKAQVPVEVTTKVAQAR